MFALTMVESAGPGAVHAFGAPPQLLGVKVVETLPVASVVPDAGTSDALNPALGYPAWVNEKTIGTPGCPELSVAVTVIAAPPATKAVAAGVVVTKVDAIVQTVNEAAG
jgi:hypothetical protein